MPRRTRSRMEKRNKPRDLTPEPASTPRRLTIVERPPAFRHQQPRFLTRDQVTQAETLRELENAERQRQARVQRGIDWSVCIVPNCGKEPPGYLHPRVTSEDAHNPDVWLPVCKLHGATIWRTMNEVFKDPNVQAEMLAADTRYNQAVERREQRIRESQGPGDIYVIRQNGLIKVGWSSQLAARLKAYGPNVEILCHYPGSRTDETNAHRLLRPSLAKGREWYHDDQAVGRFIAQAIEKHGPPTRAAWWSQPKQPVVGSRSIDRR